MIYIMIAFNLLITNISSGVDLNQLVLEAANEINNELDIEEKSVSGVNFNSIDTVRNFIENKSQASKKEDLYDSYSIRSLTEGLDDRHYAIFLELQ